MLTEEGKRRLQKKATEIRRDIVEMIGVGHAGHLGGSCSLADIVSVLYFYKMRHNPLNSKMEDRDRFILSKGHAAIVQYAALMECGYIEKEKYIHTLKKLGSKLQGHPDLRKLQGVEANTGSLGQGVSLAAGMAAGLKLDGNNARVYVVTGDGELAEGQIWEAFMASVNFKLDNLRIIIDKNNLQATGPCAERFRIENLDEKLKAFGFYVLHINGHEIEEIVWALDEADRNKEAPTVIIADTVKGKGIPFAEGKAAFHNGTLTKAQYEDALKALEEKRCEK